MNYKKYLLLAIITACIIFLIDITLPLGVAFGVPYIISILFTIQTRDRQIIIVAAVITSLLVFIGLTLSPDGGEAWKVYSNRIIAVVAIWIITFLGLLKNDKDNKLKQSEEFFKALSESGFEAIFFSEKGFCKGLNLAAIKMFGYTSEEALGLPITDFAAEESHKLIKKNIISGYSEPYEAVGKHKNGSQFSIEVRGKTAVIQNKEIRISAVIDLSLRKQTENLLHRKHQIQVLISSLLEKSLTDVSLCEFLKYAIDQITSSAVISLQNKGAIFLTSSSGKSIDLISQKNMHDELLIKCKEVPFGKCHCGSAANSKQIQFSNCVDHKHEITYDGMHPHGHYCAPILSSGNVLGVLNLYLDDGHIQNDNEKEFLSIITNTLAGIIERKQSEENLIKLSQAVESSSSGIFITDINGEIEYINKKFSAITGYSLNEVKGKTPRVLKSDRSQNDFYNQLWKTIQSGQEWKGEIRNRKKDNSLYWAKYSISSVKNTEGEIINFIAVQDDITHEYEMSEQLSFLASHDSLTGLINRREFEQRIEQVITTYRKGQDNYVLCYMDLDQFKIINDTCGHIAGDELLRQLSTTIQDIVKEGDTLARLGGDEFGLLMSRHTIEQAMEIAETILERVKNYKFIWKDQSFNLGVSIGLVLINGASLNKDELFKQADAACYMAKDKGRNRIHVYRPDDTDLSDRQGEMIWVGRINTALEENQFTLYAQPIVPLDGSADKHYEILIRLIDDDGTIIPPAAFLPAAERYNLMEIVDKWVIETAFNLLSANPEFIQQLHFISINLSGPSLTNGGFLDFIMGQFRKNKIPASKICFEVTETVAISNFNAAQTFISILKEMGCSFALDDFGSGLSSFGYLKNLPIDYLKIDGMFVKDMVDDPIDHAMVKSINDIGQVMGMQTIAEFVENNEIKGMLKSIGVNYAQGYGLGKPQPFADIIKSTVSPE